MKGHVNQDVVYHRLLPRSMNRIMHSIAC